MGLQEPNSKMSKSSTNPNDVIFLEDDPDVIMKKFKKAVTDSEGIVKYDPEGKPGVSNLIEIYSIVTGKSKGEVETEFEGQGYGTFKEAVGKAVVEKLLPIQEKYKKFIENPTYLESIYKEGDRKASTIANATIAEVKEKIGLIK